MRSIVNRAVDRRRNRSPTRPNTCSVLASVSPEVGVVTDEDVALRQIRRELVEVAHEAMAPADLLAVQRQLREALVNAERDTSGDRDSRSWHRHLLRVIGDGLAFRHLDEHLIRNLAGLGGPPAGLASQGADLDFVLETAGGLVDAGAYVVIADLTHVLGIGDFVAVHEGTALVIECKNRLVPDAPDASGRRARQRLRGETTARYLRRSYAPDLDRGRRAAIPWTAPSPRWDVLKQMADDLARDPATSSILSLGQDDWVVLATEATDTHLRANLPKMLAPTVPRQGNHLSAVRSPRWNCATPLAFPVSAALQHDLLEGDALLLRLVDLGRLNGTFQTNSGVSWTCEPPSLDGALPLTIDGEPCELDGRFLDSLMCLPISLDDLIAALGTLVDGLGRAHESPTLVDATNDPDFPELDHVPLASGDPVVYGTAYRSATSNQPVLMFNVEDLAGVGIEAGFADEHDELDGGEAFPTIVQTGNAES
jgi:hypothetical protein